MYILHIHIFNAYKNFYMYLHMHMYTQMYRYMYIRNQIGMYTHVHIYIHICLCIYIHAYQYEYICANSEVLWDQKLRTPSQTAGSVVALRLPGPDEEWGGKGS